MTIINVEFLTETQIQRKVSAAVKARLKEIGLDKKLKLRVVRGTYHMDNIGVHTFESLAGLLEKVTGLKFEHITLSMARRVKEETAVAVYTDGPAKLEAVLRETFDIQKDKPGICSVQRLGGPYSHVTVELNDFTFGEPDFEKLQQAKQQSGASGFYTTPQRERESQARHYFVFFF